MTQIDPNLSAAIVRVAQKYADFKQQTGLTPTILLVSPECIFATMNLGQVYTLRIVVDDASRPEMTCAYTK